MARTDKRYHMQVTWTRNAKLGRFTNFVNLLDMCAVSVPSAVYRHPQIGEGMMGQLCLSGDAISLLNGCVLNSLPLGKFLKCHSECHVKLTMW